uniref:WAS/WASL interacting protein family, member 2b n=1 Tax=Tetraodon nigroviridis TaxID=99883 RepID=H3CLZ5_TETNG
MPIPPPPPGGPPPAPTFSQVNSSPRRLNQEVSKGRSALLSDICQGTSLKKVEVNDRSAPLLHKPGGGGANGGPAGGRAPSGGLFSSGGPELRAVGDGSTGRSPASRAAAPRPLSHHLDDAESSAPQEPPSSCCSSILPPPAVCRRANAPAPPPTSAIHTPPLPTKPPPSPVSSRCPPSGGGKPTSSTSLAPPPPLHLVSNGPTGGGEVAPELPQHNSLSTKRAAPSPRGSTRGPAPPPPASPTPQHGSNRPPPLRETPCRGAAPPVPAQPPRAGVREAPPPPPSRMHGSPSPDNPVRGIMATRPAPSLLPETVPSLPPDDFESKYSFHPLDDFPPPEEYRHFTKIYPSRANRAVMRGAPPLPPVGR